MRASIVAIAAGLAIATPAHATDIKTAGKLDVPPNASIVAICTDPVVQNVLNEDLRAAHHGSATDPASMVTLTVSVHQQLLAPGVSLNQLFPGDPSMVELLKAAGADPPPLGDTGDQPTDLNSLAARRGASAPDDPMTAEYKQNQTQRQILSGASGPTPYDDIPKDQVYDTVIVARASVEGAMEQLKVVAVVHSGENARRAKERVAEEIANAVLH
jgi:hypothetical protein